MCGFTGMFGHLPQEALAVLQRMTTTLVHRGPDDAGYWLDEGAGVGLGHRRLSIVDLSPLGHQPMASPCGRWMLAFNGEIYNFQVLREELTALGFTWRGHSDTEVMLAAFEAWGVSAAVQRFVGMFAFAVWDARQQTLTLGRDRLGEKPLYYGQQSGALIFGSELKALRAFGRDTPALNQTAVSLFLRYGYVPTPHTIYSGFYKLSPGCLLTVGREALAAGTLPVPVAYWSLADIITTGLREPLHLDDIAATDCLEQQLRESVRVQMVADVPLGAFLSGGVDSSTIVALMQTQSSQPVKTFTIGFDEAAYNEADHAKAVAQHLGTDHTECYLSTAQAQAIVPKLAHFYDEPFADSSQIPTLLVSQIARQQVTVSLSGDAGDELFGGYTRYFVLERLLATLRRYPAWTKQSAAWLIERVPATVWRQLLTWLTPLLPAGLHQSHPVDKLYKLGKVLQDDTPEAVYQQLISQCYQPAQLLLHPSAGDSLLPLAHTPTLPTLEWMMFNDTLHYLPDDILVKVDRAAMAVSLEGRIPMLDHRVVELAWRLPREQKVRDGQGKWLLRQVLYRHVPATLIERPKQGFGVPVGDWLRQGLRPWAESLLSVAALERSGVWQVSAVRACWQAHLAGTRHQPAMLWAILMFQAWAETHLWS